MIRRAAAVALTIGLASGALGCSSRESDFCNALADRFDLAGLQRALDAGDDAATTRELRNLQELRDLAPDEIKSDADNVIDTAISTVRAITGVRGPDGQTAPVDTTSLPQRLWATPRSSQKAYISSRPRTQACAFRLPAG